MQIGSVGFRQAPRVGIGLLLLLMLGACGGDDAAKSHIRGGRPLTLDHPEVAPALKVQQRVAAELMKQRAVIGTGITLDADGVPALLVLVDDRWVDAPKAIDGVPVVVRPAGRLSAYDEPAVAEANAGVAAHRFERPVPIGISSAHPAVSNGTLGCRVRNDAGALFALSNNHVYANDNAASPTDVVLQPSAEDGGRSADAIGELSDFEPLDFRPLPEGENRIDAAIAASDGARLGTATPSGGYGRPREAVYEAALFLPVQKYGRTTGLKQGQVIGLNVAIEALPYGGGKVAGFVGLIMIADGPFAKGGDSGSLVVVAGGSDARKPVGLVIGGGPYWALACPIGPVLYRFGVTVDGD